MLCHLRFLAFRSPAIIETVILVRALSKFSVIRGAPGRRYTDINLIFPSICVSISIPLSSRIPISSNVYFVVFNLSSDEDRYSSACYFLVPVLPLYAPARHAEVLIYFMFRFVYCDYVHFGSF